MRRRVRCMSSSLSRADNGAHLVEEKRAALLRRRMRRRVERCDVREEGTEYKKTEKVSKQDARGRGLTGFPGWNEDDCQGVMPGEGVENQVEKLWEEGPARSYASRAQLPSV